MKVVFDVDYRSCIIKREDDDPRIKMFRPGYPDADPDSSFLYALKNRINVIHQLTNTPRRYRWIKKRMSAEGLNWVSAPKMVIGEANGVVAPSRFETRLTPIPVTKAKQCILLRGYNDIYVIWSPYSPGKPVVDDYNGSAGICILRYDTVPNSGIPEETLETPWDLKGFRRLKS